MKAVQFVRDSEEATADDILPSDVFHLHYIDEEKVRIYYFSREAYDRVKR